MKHFATNSSEVFALSQLIIRRNADLKNGDYTVVDCNNLNFGDVYIIGIDCKPATVALEQVLPSCKDYRDLAGALMDLEYLFNIQVWDSTEFDLRKVLEM